MTEREKERRGVASASPAHPRYAGVGQTVATASPRGSAFCVNALRLVALGSHSLRAYLMSSPLRAAVALPCKYLARWPEYTPCLK